MQSFWQRVQAVSDAAKASNHLVVIDNEIIELGTGRNRFILRYAPHLKQKFSAPTSASPANPFLTPEDALIVEERGDYRIILNKYPAISNHALLTTKHFVEQTHQLRIEDFQAVAEILSETDALIFYNGGQVAGASQRHRHFQIVPRGLGTEEMPLDTWLSSLGSHEALFNFRHRFQLLPNYAAETLLDSWMKLEFSWQPYNLLMTREWILVVPRSCAVVEGVALNSLAFAGAVLATSEAQMDTIKRAGIFSLLHKAVTLVS